ncbi:MAG: sigma factor-like helix-turn-helix DNA-binding protein, partial [Nostocoides sp.]
RLPEQQRLAVAYHYYGGLPHTETADLIGSTPAAVRRAASDGIASLRRSVGRLDPSDPSDPTERT